MKSIRSEFLKFATIGGFVYIFDIGIFNALHYIGPFKAKAISSLIAITIAYIANRHWTYRGYDKERLHKEYILFLTINLLSMALALSCLFISHYILRFHSLFADNISANVVGVFLGTLFRFYGYRTWVFKATNRLAGQRANLVEPATQTKA
jgi:putative flippase GtrA